MDFIESSDEESQEESECELDLEISENQADYNYMLAGTEIPEPPDEISIAKYQHFMLNDQVHRSVMEVLSETNIRFKLADFQLGKPSK